ncbi:Hypothetical protein PBC10988_28220 [Planctomycetales bacterium 10988]|nr:Hypothetical protein PBC10988_28220 [Planctomycetales bacterium 10988]
MSDSSHATDSALDGDYRSWYARNSRLIVLIAVCLVPPMLFGVVRAMMEANNNIRQWLPPGTQETIEYEWFVEQFVTDETVILSWKKATIDDPRVAELTDAFRKDDTGWIERVRNGTEVLDTLMGPPFKLSKEQSLKRLEGVLVGPDHAQTALLVNFTEKGNEEREEAVHHLEEVAKEVLDLTSDQLHIAGEPATNAEVDKESRAAIRKWFVLAWLTAFVIAAWSLRSWRLIGIVFGTALFCAGLGVATVYYTGSEMNLVLVVMPILVGVLALASAIHLANYYRDSIDIVGRAHAVVQAVNIGWAPCALSAGTTAIGLGSLLVSDIIPVKMFGLYSAIGLMLSLVMLFLLLPCLLELFPLRFRHSGELLPEELEAQKSKDGDSDEEPDSETDSDSEIEGEPDYQDDPDVEALAAPAKKKKKRGTRSEISLGHAKNAAAPDRHPIDRLLSRFAAGIVHRHALFAMLGIFLMAFMGIGISLIKSDVEPLNFFAKENKLVQDTYWLQENLGPIVPIEIILKFGPENEQDMFERMELIQKIQVDLKELDRIGYAMSAVSLVPPLPGSEEAKENEQETPSSAPRGGGRLFGPLARLAGIRNQEQAERGVFRERLEENRSHFVDEHFLATDGDDELWRISARAPELSDSDYAVFLAKVDERIHSYIDEYKDIRFVVTGIDPLFFRVSTELLKGLYESFILAFGLIAIVMMIMLRRLGAGLLIMIPNIFPAVLIFGSMGWLGIKIDIGSMMTASVAMGIAVDDTLHFLTWFHRALVAGESRQSAIQIAYVQCARAMTQTTTIAGLGMLMMGFSSFAPVSQFGILMCVLLFAALLGDLVFLPAILAGPFGKIFESKNQLVICDTQSAIQSISRAKTAQTSDVL